jgi:hypothetical protein
MYGFYFEYLPDGRFQPVQALYYEDTAVTIPSNLPAITQVCRQVRSESLTLLISKYLALPRPGPNIIHSSDHIAEVLFRWFAHFHGEFRAESIKTIRAVLPNRPDPRTHLSVLDDESSCLFNWVDPFGWQNVSRTNPKFRALDLRLVKGGTLIVHSLFQERWPFLFEVPAGDMLDRERSRRGDRPWNGRDLIEFWIGMMRTWTGKRRILPQPSRSNDVIQIGVVGTREMPVRKIGDGFNRD